jgi:hypothetical protein
LSIQFINLPVSSNTPKKHESANWYLLIGITVALVAFALYFTITPLGDQFNGLQLSKSQTNAVEILTLPSPHSPFVDEVFTSPSFFPPTFPSSSSASPLSFLYQIFLRLFFFLSSPLSFLYQILVYKLFIQMTSFSCSALQTVSSHHLLYHIRFRNHSFFIVHSCFTTLFFKPFIHRFCFKVHSILTCIEGGEERTTRSDKKQHCKRLESEELDTIFTLFTTPQFKECKAATQQYLCVL